MSRVHSYRTAMNCLLGLASFVAAIAITGCTPVPSDAQQVNGPDQTLQEEQLNANDNDETLPGENTDDDTVPFPPPLPDTPVDDGGAADEPTEDPDADADDAPPADDADDDLNVAETPDPFEETPFLPPSEEPADPNPPTGGTGGNPDPPAQDPPAEDPPAEDPPAEDPPAEDPPAEDPPAEDPPGEHPPEQPSPEWPDNAYCAPSEFWPDAWGAFEEQVLVLVNQHRAAGANCGSAGSFAATTPLAMDPALRCAARAHSTDMNMRDFFSHTNPDGQGPGYRITQAGYSFSWWGENIAWGYPTPESVVLGWMNSPGHCANIMNANFTEIGVGYYQDNYWTQAFGRPSN